MANASEGRIICGLTDDHKVDGNIFDIVDRMNNFPANRRFKIATLPAEANAPLTHPETTPTYPELLRTFDCFMHLPLFNVMCFPVVERSTFETYLNGCLAHPYLKTMCDWYLGYYVYINDGPGIQFDGINLIRDEKYDFQICYEENTDPITGSCTCQSHFGETVVNMYRLIKNYRRGDPYVDVDNQPAFLSEEEILSVLSHNEEQALLGDIKKLNFTKE